MTNHSMLIQSLYQIGVFHFGEIRLKSGQTSSFYINLRKIISYPEILRMIADAMWKATMGCSFDLVCGVPYTALPIATCFSLQQHVPMIMRRKEKKAYGTKQSIEGEFQAGQHCLLMEDVITTGGSVLETALELESAGLQIKDIVVLVDREQGGREMLDKKYHLHTVLTLSGILTTLSNSMLLNTQERGVIEQLSMTKAIE